MQTIASTPLDSFHRRLYELNVERLRPSGPDAPFDPATTLPLLRAEEVFLQGERRAVAERAQGTPTNASASIEMFGSLRRTGPGQHDRLFDWLAEEADESSMRWFLGQELATEAGFDDLVALTQRRMPKQAKLELANNHWDEMGRGNEGSMHGPMLDALTAELRIDDAPPEPTWEALAVCNGLMGMAYNRRWAYHALGALGVVELTAPDRCALIKRGLERLGVSKTARRYYALHEVIDERHYARWASEVLRPVVAARPPTACWMLEGALMRLRAGARTFDRYRRHLLTAGATGATDDGDASKAS